MIHDTLADQLVLQFMLNSSQRNQCVSTTPIKF